MKITATRLRQDIYRVLDRALETGEVVEIERAGRTLTLRAERAGSRLDRLERRPAYLRVEAEELVDLDWSDSWKPSI